MAGVGPGGYSELNDDIPDPGPIEKRINGSHNSHGSHRGSCGSHTWLAWLAWLARRFSRPQFVRRKATRTNENRRCTLLLGCKKSKIWLPKPCFKEAPVGVYKLNTLMKTMSQKAGLGLNFKKPQQQKNYDSNFSQQRRSANGYYATNATTKNLKVSLELLYHRKKTAEHFSH